MYPIKSKVGTYDLSSYVSFKLGVSVSRLCKTAVFMDDTLAMY